jgi:hypothetical protein
LRPAASSSFMHEGGPTLGPFHCAASARGLIDPLRRVPAGGSERVDKQDYNDGSAENDRPVGDLNTSYRCCLVKPVHDLPP